MSCSDRFVCPDTRQSIRKCSEVSVPDGIIIMKISQIWLWPQAMISMNRPPSRALWEFLMRIIILPLWSVSQGRFVYPDTSQSFRKCSEVSSPGRNYHHENLKFGSEYKKLHSMNRSPSRALWEFLMRMIILPLWKCLTGKIRLSRHPAKYPENAQIVEFPDWNYHHENLKFEAECKQSAQWIVLQAKLFENFSWGSLFFHSEVSHSARFVYPDTLLSIRKCSDSRVSGWNYHHENLKFDSEYKQSSQWIVLQAVLFENFSWGWLFLHSEVSHRVNSSIQTPHQSIL